MKRFSEQNYYEVLEVSYRATWGEIQKAYELARKTYGTDSAAAYSLFDREDREQIYKKIEEAYRTLIDQEKRKKYDESISKEIEALAEPVAAPAEAPAPSLLLDETTEPGEINGKVLKQMRERQGISVQEIADRTRINITYLLHIEEDNFKSLPAEVYLRSYLLQYAKMLHWNTQKIVEGYLKVYLQWKKEKAEPN
ncbi:MAG: helix-turn-helix domain-containing protein [Nitrospirae bacterium]|nr:helix-turn-helix domain-containing protein [Candidatus Manganitrophaceae bacterium]